MEIYEEQKPLYVRVLTMLTPKQVKRLDEVARRETMSRSLLIRQACELILEKMETGQAA